MALRIPSVCALVVFLPLWAAAGEHEGKTLPRVTNEPYKATCGSCHLAYQPGLLPSRSWLKIVDEPGGHPGGDLRLDEKTKAALRGYLGQNGAEASGSKRSRKIVASLGGGAPTRISDVPYIREKHHEIAPQVFSRASVGSRGNCVACHRTAESGDYDDDNVSIPK